jgi:hypothetical protein
MILLNEKWEKENEREGDRMKGRKREKKSAWE